MLQQFLFILLVCRFAVAQPRAVVIEHGCANPLPVLPHDGPGCGVSAEVNTTEFGDNNDAVGTLRIIPQSRGLTMDVRVSNLSRPDLVITAWVLWIDDRSTNNPEIFRIADPASPMTSFRAPFTSGMGRDPNRLIYIGPTDARIRKRLNFNPTYPNEGALARRDSCFQSDQPGVQETDFAQPEVPGTGIRVGVSSDYLRIYDQETGFEKLDRQGRPIVVPSPVRALAVTLIVHTDKTTHGISPGDLGVDHFELMSFFLPPEIGSPTQ